MKIINKIIGVFIIASLTVGLQSCDGNRYFEQNIEILNNNWAYNDAQNFYVDITDTTSSFNFYLNIRNTTDYPYANLYLFIQTTFPDSVYARDTIEFQLANVDGRWMGEGYGEYKYSHFILREAMRFSQKGVHEFSIEHGMRKDTLSGISDIGIRLEYYP